MTSAPLNRLRKWKHDPLKFVQEAFDWGRVPGHAGPSTQQADALNLSLIHI